MKNMWIVLVEATFIGPDGYKTHAGIPTFFLNGDIHAIQDENHAEKIARRIVDPFGLLENVSISVAKSDE